MARFLLRICRLENHIKEQQRRLFADRTSAHHWWANRFRLLLSSMAFLTSSSSAEIFSKCGVEEAIASEACRLVHLHEVGGEPAR
jgi:hypothetical protein